MSIDNNVHKLKTVKPDESQVGESEQTVQASMDQTQRDMSKVAIIVSLLVVVLLIIFFFGMNRNIAGLTDEVKSLGALREDVSSLDQRVVQMEEDMPAKMKRMIAQDIVNEMAMRAAYLGNTLDDEALRVKMQEILQNLKEVRGELAE
ncbi:hypothetical protein [Pseudodesulfovibrio sediminis]|uniref:Uncharacterized protein n=1 Tax=Pseudodesulfovibrio sediminis TaxID=2810563 RepID=A0ABN6ENS2_9BACT|nr:hypothetical protein [Pseudodesulfovibrio sediminis]BCS86944.1 hypothetical protein PSDVSF_01860 [Pseudodesulfovibrio sediminis]